MIFDLREKLTEPFLPTDLEWRVGQAGKKNSGEVWAKVLAYVTNRAIMDRLDAVVGPGNWQNEYKPWDIGTPGVMCGIGIKIESEWVWKWDGAEQPKERGEGQPVAVKGGFSMAMKRTAVQWGIGRYLYDLPEGWAIILKDKAPGCHYTPANKTKELPAFYWMAPEVPKWALPAIPKDQK